MDKPNHQSMLPIDPSEELEPILTKTMADIVEARLRENFRKRNYKPGDSLPTEMEMAQSLGVSRNVVREALSRLRMLGIVETRKKRGMVMSRPDILGSFEKVLDPFMIDEATLRDIFELRLVLEMGLPDLLFPASRRNMWLNWIKSLVKKRLQTVSGSRTKSPSTANCMRSPATIRSNGFKPCFSPYLRM